MKSLSSEFVKRFFIGAVFTENADKEEHLFLLASRLLSIDFFVRGDLASAGLCFPSLWATLLPCLQISICKRYVYH